MTADSPGARAVFLDKDGTLVDDIPYNIDPEKVTFKPGTISALSLLQEAGFRLFVISNQSGVAKGYFTADAVHRLARYMQLHLESRGVLLNAFYYCPHYPGAPVEDYSADCDCRKPAAGLFFKAAKEWNLDLARSWMIGDILDDVEAGHRAGCRSVLLDNGGEDQWLEGKYRKPDYSTPTILSAAEYILRNE